mgnify:CR=1 FL=1
MSSSPPGELLSGYFDDLLTVEQHQVLQLAHAAVALHRHVGVGRRADVRLGDRRELLPRALGRERARRHRVHADAVAAPLDRQRLRHRVHRGLGHRRGQHVGRAGPHPGDQHADHRARQPLRDPALAAGQTAPDLRGGGGLAEEERTRIADRCASSGRSIEGLLEEASAMLAGLSQAAGLVLSPKTEATAIRHIEFVALGPGRVLVVLVTEDGQVENRVIEAPPGLPPRALQEAANYLNSRHSGRKLEDARRWMKNPASPEFVAVYRSNGYAISTIPQATAVQQATTTPQATTAQTFRTVPQTTWRTVPVPRTTYVPSVEYYWVYE